MKKKIVAVLGTAAAALALLPATQASAAHNIGGYARQCVAVTGGSRVYNSVEVAVDGLGSDAAPRNYYSAARARVTATRTCAKAGGVAAIRVQIDRVALISGARRVTVSGRGPINNGTGSVTADTAGVHRACGENLRASVRFSVRYQDGSRSAGGLLTGTYFRRC